MDPQHPESLGADAGRRREWLCVLAKASAAELEAAWSALDDKPSYRVLRRPETGLALVRGRIGGSGKPFNVGEMTMSRAAVQLRGATGSVVTGFGHVAGREQRRAELVAVFDALLQLPERHDALQARVIGPLAAAQSARKAEAAKRVAASRVEFFTMVRGE